MQRFLIAIAITIALCSGLYAASNALSSLIAGSAVNGTDLFYDVQTVGTGGVKVTGAQIKTFMSSSPTFTGTVTHPDNSTWTAAGLNTLTFTGQLISGGGTPSVASCGTSPTGAVSATSTNQSGSLKTGGTGTLTSCGIGFSAAFTSTPKTCTIVAESSAAASDMTQTFVSALTAGGWTLSAVNTLNSATFGYICL